MCLFSPKKSGTLVSLSCQELCLACGYSLTGFLTHLKGRLVTNLFFFKVRGWEER